MGFDKNMTYGKLQFYSLWIYRLAIMNILWILFSMLGLLVFGIGPATTAVCGVIHRWLKHEQIQESTFNHFWHIYKENFVKANVLWFIFLFVGFALYFDFYFIFRLDHFLVPVLLGLVGFLSILYVIVLIFSFALLVILKSTIVQTIKYAFIYGLTSPSLTISILMSLVIIHYISYQFPVVYLFFTVSVASLLIVVVVIKNTSKLKMDDSNS
ncbi:YesL family protein [Salipaludibacillus sp. HK11]|uniref:YesL family protein n=1 Tax=Salipaludibacillus sp. HK11 TaxID=3394320 RepID=UPI0039FC386E